MAAATVNHWTKLDQIGPNWTIAEVQAAGSSNGLSEKRRDLMIKDD